MSAILGLIQRKNHQLKHEQLKQMQGAISHWGPDSFDLWSEGRAGLGQLRLHSTPEAHREQLPLFDQERGIAFTAAGRVDNRSELISQLGLSDTVPDGDILFATYCHWGEEAASHLFGDWSFAAWHPKEQRLFLARDPIGNTALYYYFDDQTFAFASDRRALLALNLTAWEMDELFLAQVMITWADFHGQRTAFQQLKRLPPAHSLTLTAENIYIRQYWHLENTPLLTYKKREDYAAAFQEEFNRAVRTRLRSPNGQMAVTLSGGLDSGSVTAAAAEMLMGEGRRLDAYTSVPVYDTQPYVGPRFGDELPFAQATAEFCGNVDHHQVKGTTISPIEAIRRGLATAGDPFHAAGNQFWLWDIENTAQMGGHRVLLTGQLGNAGVSWVGDVHSQHLVYQLSLLGWRRWLKSEIIRLTPAALFKLYRRRYLPENLEYPNTAIHPDFAKRLDLWNRYLDDNQKPPTSPIEQRLAIIKPGRTIVGALHAQRGAAHGLDVRDPTGDARLLAFTLSVPDHIFRDPKTGLDRWLIREGMRGRLPDDVRLNRKRGRQSGDLVPRLRDTAGEVEETLNQMQNGPAAGYVNMPYMRRIWRIVQSEDSMLAFNKATTVLTRGIMAGLFVNNFYAKK